jgi:hypothetical protein
MYLTNSKLVIQMISFCRHQSFLLFSLLVLLASFSLSAQSPATLAITSNDSDNVITTGQVTLTATFSQNMTASPTISIAGVVTNVAMTQSTTAAVWTYYWQVPSNISSGTTLNVTATATDTNSLSYSGNASLTLTISPTFYLDANGVTVKCRGCSVGDTGMVSGTLYKAVGDATYSNGTASDNSLHREIQIWSSSGSQGNYQLCTTLVTDMSDLFGTIPVNNLISTWDFLYHLHAILDRPGKYSQLFFCLSDHGCQKAIRFSSMN